MTTFCIVCNKQTWFAGSNEKYITTRFEGRNYYTCDICRRDLELKRMVGERRSMLNFDKPKERGE